MREELIEAGVIDDPALEAAFLEDRHRYPRDSFDTATDDFAFESIQPRVIPIGQFDERDSLGDLDDVRQSVWAEADEAARASRGCRADVASALAAGVRQ